MRLSNKLYQAYKKALNKVKELNNISYEKLV